MFQSLKFLVCRQKRFLSEVVHVAVSVEMQVFSVAVVAEQVDDPCLLFRCEQQFAAMVAVVCGPPSHMGFDAVAQRGVIFELDVLEQCVEAVGRMYYPYGFVAGAGVFFQNCRVDGEASEFVVGDVFAGQETEACVGFRAFV